MALALSLNARGTVSILGLPTSSFRSPKGSRVQPSTRRGIRTGDGSCRGRMLVGGKGWLYGEKLLQAQIIAGAISSGTRQLWSARGQ